MLLLNLAMGLELRLRLSAIERALLLRWHSNLRRGPSSRLRMLWCRAGIAQ